MLKKNAQFMWVERHFNACVCWDSEQSGLKFYRKNFAMILSTHNLSFMPALPRGTLFAANQGGHATVESDVSLIVLYLSIKAVNALIIHKLYPTPHIKLHNEQIIQRANMEKQTSDVWVQKLSFLFVEIKQIMAQWTYLNNTELITVNCAQWWQQRTWGRTLHQVKKENGEKMLDLLLYLRLFLMLTKCRSHNHCQKNYVNEDRQSGECRHKE